MNIVNLHIQCVLNYRAYRAKLLLQCDQCDPALLWEMLSRWQRALCASHQSFWHSTKDRVKIRWLLLINFQVLANKGALDECSVPRPLYGVEMTVRDRRREPHVAYFWCKRLCERLTGNLPTRHCRHSIAANGSWIPSEGISIERRGLCG